MLTSNKFLYSIDVKKRYVVLRWLRSFFNAPWKLFSFHFKYDIRLMGGKTFSCILFSVGILLHLYLKYFLTSTAGVSGNNLKIVRICFFIVEE